jgi:hypothetical protein
MTRKFIDMFQFFDHNRHGLDLILEIKNIHNIFHELILMISNIDPFASLSKH